MGRKAISPKQRSIPVSFSVKPALADRIEDMAYDQRFSRSKFLSEAVLRYINFIEMGGLEGTEDPSEMSATRKVVIGLNALNDAVRDDDFTIPNNILQNLTRAIDFYKMSESNSRSYMDKFQDLKAYAKETENVVEIPIKGVDVTVTYEVEFERITAGDYAGNIEGKQVATIRKHNSKWVANYGFGNVWYDTLKQAKQDIQDFFEIRGV